MISNTSNIELLSRLGLHPQSISIYIDLLGNGNSPIHTIAKRTGLERTTLYRKLPELLEDGLIYRELRGKRYWYGANSPELLWGLLEDMGDRLWWVIDSLTQVYKSTRSGVLPIVRVDQGIKAINRVYDECARILPVGGTYYRYSSRMSVSDNYQGLTKYKALRDSKKLQRLVITNQDLYDLSISKPGRETLSFPSEFPFKQNFQKIIYADRVAIIDLESLTVCTIESAMMASFEAAIFKSLFTYIRASRGSKI